MEYSIGDRIIFNKNYNKRLDTNSYTTSGAEGWVEKWLIGREAVITAKVPFGAVGSQKYWYYINIPKTHGYDEALFSKHEVLVEA